MTTPTIGQQYDKIAKWWQHYHESSDYGVPQLEKALTLAPTSGKALDVGCGSGGRLLQRLENREFKVTGLDASSEMIALARTSHPNSRFIKDDIQQWETDETFDFILAWDSLFHLPWNAHQPVLSKLCQMLSKHGVMIYSCGSHAGEHTDFWRDQEFYYSSVGITKNIDILHSNGMSLLHLERDQMPEDHAFIISKKTS